MTRKQILWFPLFTAALAFLFAGPLAAQEFPKKPEGMVNDLANVLPRAERNALESYLRKVRQETSNEIAVAIFPNAQGYDPATFSNNVARAWGVGSERDNGALIALFMAEKKSAIQVGYGLEPYLTDLESYQIRTEIMRPLIREGKLYQALTAGAGAIAQKAKEGFNQSQNPNANQFRDNGARQRKGDTPAQKILSILVFAGIIFVIWLLFRGGRGGRGGGGGGFFFLPFFWGGGGGYGGGGGWNDGGGFGGGDFGGFGGGDFGGGGSAGDW